MSKKEVNIKLSVLVPELIEMGIEKGWVNAHKQYKDPSESILKDCVKEEVIKVLEKYIVF